MAAMAMTVCTPWQVAEGDQGEEEPPDAHRADRDPGGEDGVDRDHAVAELNQGKGEEQVEPAADVAPGEPPRADHVDGLVRGELGQIGVVEDVGADESEMGEQKDPEGHQHVACGCEEEKRGEQGAPGGEDHQESLLGGGEVGDGSEDRGDEEHQQRADADDHSPEILAVPVAAEHVDTTVAHHLRGEIGGEHGGEDGRGVCGVGPVVGDPGADRPRMVLVLAGHFAGS
jgi:hypothetical protein